MLCVGECFVEGVVGADVCCVQLVEMVGPGSIVRVMSDRRTV